MSSNKRRTYISEKVRSRRGFFFASTRNWSVTAAWLRGNGDCRNVPPDFFVKHDHDPPAEGAVSSHTTHWTIVMRAVQGKAQGGQSALAELCRLYWYPLYIFARLSGHSPEGAQDLIQGFFLHLLEHRGPTVVDRLKGKFRSFLLASLQNYLSDELDRTRCLKRGR